jgi:hypothetical protein
MAHLDTHFSDRQKPKRASKRAGKWSGRASIGFALLASGLLWALIFVAAKALVG